MIEKSIYPLINLSPGTRISSEYVEKILRVLNPKYIQIRIKNGSEEDFFYNIDVCESVLNSSDSSRTELIINDNFHAASQTKSCFVHLGQDDADPFSVKEKFPDMRIGLSTHSFSQIKDAMEKPVSYVGFGPVFKTKTKRTKCSTVEKYCEDAYRFSNLPIVFIGGITPSNISRLPEGEEVMYAVISSLNKFMSVYDV